MEVRVIAATSIESYIAVDSSARYCVLTSDDSQEINLGDVLTGGFDGSAYRSYSVHNVTQGEFANICLQIWKCSLDQAVETLLSFKHAQPITVHAGAKTFVSNNGEIAPALKEEILNSPNRVGFP